MMKPTGAAALFAVLLQSSAQQPALQTLCGRVDSITCAGPESPVTLTVHVDREHQFKAVIRPEHRPAFGPRIQTRYEERSVCVTPRAIADNAVVVETPEEMPITSEPKLAPLPEGVHDACDTSLIQAEVRRSVHPKYLREAFDHPPNIAVRMRVVVEASGSVGQVVILKGVSRGIDEEAMAAVRQWRFRPARLKSDGTAVASVVQIEMTFHRR